MRLFILFAFALSTFGQDNFYRFIIDQDHLSGAADFSFLNHPLTPADKIAAVNGHFVTASGQPVRFFGVNLAFGANFPSLEDAPRIAKRLRRLGVNLVRLHHMDSQPDSNPATAGSLLTTGPYPTLNENSVALLRNFLDALKNEGIYVNLNLKVGYVFRPTTDGIPNATIPTQSKPLHMIDARMIALQQEYARKVLTALQLHDDPVLAMVEINNESSLAYSWQTNQFETLITGPYRDSLTQNWNRFLQSRYQSTASLRDAWGASQPDSTQLLPNRWQLEIHAPSQASLKNIDGGAIQIDFTRNDALVIAKQVGFDIVQNEGYLATVELRADIPTSVSLDVKQDVSPWRSMTSRTLSVTPAWQSFTMPFAATFSMESIGRLGLQIERSINPVQIRNATLIRRGRRGLDPQESLELATVALPGSEAAFPARQQDFLDFLASADKSYLDAILSAIREATRGQVPVAGTQLDFGGMLNLDSHRGLDYQDFHFYVDHYNFPNVAWDGRDWRIRNSSHLQSNLSNIVNMAAARPLGLPFTVSEFNQNWPNTYGHELLVPLAVYGAFQDWDGLMHFAYSHGRTWDAAVPNGFNLNGDWSKWISFGQAAWLFRSGAIQSPAETLAIPTPPSDRMRYTAERRNRNFAQWLSDAKGVQTLNLLRYKTALATASNGAAPPPLTALPPTPLVSSTDEFFFHQSAKLFVIQSANAAGAIGEWSGPIDAGVLKIEPAANIRAFRTILLTPVDNQPIATSKRLLLTTPGSTLRSQPGIESRPQRIVPYPNTTDWFTVERDQPARPSGDLNGGTAPTWMERTDTWITFTTDAASLHVYPLDGAGNRLEPLPIEPVAGGFRFKIGETSPWFEIEQP